MPMLTFNNWSPFGHIRLDEDLWYKFASGVWSCDASCADVTANGEVFLGGSRCWGFQAAHASPMTHVGHRTTEQLLPSLENHGFRHCWLNALVLGSLLLKQNVDRKLGMLALIMHIIERSFQICKHVLPFLVGSLRHLQWSCFNCLGGWCKSMFWLACRWQLRSKHHQCNVLANIPAGVGFNSTTCDVVRCPIYPFTIHFLSFSTLQEAEGHWVVCR
jgi:hypothetical protein